MPFPRPISLPSLTQTHLNQIHAQFIKCPKPHTLNPLLSSLANSPSPHHALQLYNHMLRRPSSHNHYTFPLALKACSALLALRKGQEIHSHVVKSGHFADIFVQNSLLHFYLVQHEVAPAKRVFESIDGPDVVSWTSIVSGLAKCGREEEALRMFASMDVKPNVATLVSLVACCCGLRAVKLGRAIHGYCFRNLRKCGIVFDNALLDLYVKCGSLDTAKHLFVGMPDRDVISWTTMIGGYALSGLCEEAMELFRELVRGGEAEPNEATVVNLLLACSSSGSLAAGRWVYDYVISQDILSLEGSMGNAFINMFVKCGSVFMAIQVFNKLLYKDIISWSTMIGGLAMNGYGSQALQLFSLMIVHDVPLDDVTFLSLLSACSHAGLVAQGQMLYQAMNSVYGIVPQLQHYACMVDMYGRAGLLEEAENFIKKMPVGAEGPVWGALLNACKVHGDEKMFERIKQKLSQIRGTSIGTFALLSNTYASCEKWEESNRVRDAMRDMGLKKMPGSSWIEGDLLACPQVI